MPVILALWIAWVAGGYAIAATAEEPAASAPDTCQVVSPSLSLLHDSKYRWSLGIDPQQGVVYFGLDSDGTGREKTNRFARPASVSWSGAGANKTRWQQYQDGVWTCSIPGTDAGIAVTWSISREGDHLLWRIAYTGAQPATDLKVTLPFDPLMGAAVLIPARLDTQGRGLGPWLLVIPDAGHLLVEAEPAGAWFAVNDGVRGWAATNAPNVGVDPRLRGKDWLKAAGIPNYKPGQLTLQFVCMVRVQPSAMV